MFEKLKQFKELRDKAKQIQASLASEKVEGTAAWGKVKIEMDGNQAVTAVVISDDLLRVEEKKNLESGIRDALSDALKKAQYKAMEKMKDVGGLNIPGLS